jgi:hypothetical protein
MNGSTRKLVCPACARAYNQHEKDIAAGFQLRKVHIDHSKLPPVHSTNTTTVHGMVMQSIVHDQVPLMCDHCGIVITPGTPSVGITEWRGEEPGNWEWEFGGPMPANKARPMDESTRRAKEKTDNLVSKIWAQVKNDWDDDDDD